ncbi:putative reverse transcriptase domain-containing protein [Tanacetum coccineum]
MERGFLSQKGSVGRGVKEKQVLMADQSVKVHGIRALSCANEENMNDVGTKVGPTPTGNTPCMSSYANDTRVSNRKALNFHTLFTPPGNGVDVVVPMKSIRAISEWFANTAYGFFLGKRVAYPIVANYVKNTWGKYGLVKTMLNSSTRIFFFKFSSIDGLDVMLVYGPWFIHNNPFILKKWNPDVNLLKEDVGNILVWVKLHGVSVTAFSEDSLSAIATKLGTPLMLDYYISGMCIKSWGRCACCKVFGHDLNDCPKNKNTDVVKNIKKPNQATRGVAVSLKVQFKTVKQMDRQKLIGNDDYGIRPTYGCAMYEGQDIPDMIQAICDNLDMKVRGCKKK